MREASKENGAIIAFIKKHQTVMGTLTNIKNALLHLFYPHSCAGCGTDTLPPHSHLCIKCMHSLPVTGFEKHANNPIEKMLTGRVPFEKATAQLYFTKHAALQNIIHAFKYSGNKALGHQLGLMMGHHLLESKRFSDIEVLIPLPLHKSKESKRGYNQAEVLCRGMAEILNVPVATDVVIRLMATETQTRKNRVQRWQNMAEKFTLTPQKGKIENKQVLLVDDVITTGATVEACAHALLQANGLRLNIATLGCASSI